MRANQSTYRLSAHFWLHDFDAGVKPSLGQVANLTRLCLSVLEPLLIHAGSLRIVNGLSKYPDGDCADIVKAKNGRFNGSPSDLWDAFHACGRLDGACIAIMNLTSAGRPVDLFVRATPIESAEVPQASRGLWLRREGVQDLERFSRR